MSSYVVLLAMLFNLLNGYANGRWVARFGTYDPQPWRTMQGLAGILLFVAGGLGNVWADNRLLELRRHSFPTGAEPRYRIPQRGLFTLVSSPHYLCELVEWMGYALLTNAPPAWLFVLATAANLVPRALHSHTWYQKTFPAYPANRKAIIPWLL
ncbi:hypothetical protein H4R33_005444 [Dimargaris cristalligena]|nr:hypothetical protein H4R33_005444 [Dimargaris cristalligena]